MCRQTGIHTGGRCDRVAWLGISCKNKWELVLWIRIDENWEVVNQNQIGKIHALRWTFWRFSWAEIRRKRFCVNFVMICAQIFGLYLRNSYFFNISEHIHANLYHKDLFSFIPILTVLKNTTPDNARKMISAVDTPLNLNEQTNKQHQIHRWVWFDCQESMAAVGWTTSFRQLVC